MQTNRALQANGRWKLKENCVPNWKKGFSRKRFVSGIKLKVMLYINRMEKISGTF
jgi:hypothetical protein